MAHCQALLLQVACRTVSGDEEYPSLASVVGKNARTLRGDLSGDRLANAARKHGLNWGTGRIADLEAGRVSPTLPTLISLALALGDVRGQPVKLADLLHHDGFVTVSGDLVLSGEALTHFVSGWPVHRLLRYLPGGAEKIASLIERVDDSRAQMKLSFVDVVDKRLSGDIYQRSGEAEERAARALDIDTYDLAIAAAYLWGRSLSDERDRRAGSSATAQKRGRITRQLYDELKAALDGDD